MSDQSWTPPGDEQPSPTPPPTQPPPPPPSVAWPTQAAPPPPPMPAPPAGQFAAPQPPGSGAWSGGRMIPLRPMRLGEILDAAFKLLRSTAVQAALLVAITLGAFNVLSSFVMPVMPGMFADPAELEAMFADEAVFFARFGAYLLLAMFGQLLIYPLVRGGVTGIALAADRGGDASWQAGLRLGLALAGRLLSLAFLLLGLGIVALVVVSIAIVLPIVLLAQAQLVPLAVLYGLVAGALTVLVGLVATALIRLAVPVVVVERLGATAALRRSYALVRPQLPRIVGIVLLTGLLLGVIGGVLGVASIPFSLFGGRASQLATGLITTLGLMITVPLEANIGLLLYVDARVRLEGLDVAVLTAELDDA